MHLGPISASHHLAECCEAYGMEARLRFRHNSDALLFAILLIGSLLFAEFVRY